MFNVALFDLDGTLFHTLPDIYRALSYVLKKNNLIIPSEEMAAGFMGDGLHQFLTKAVSLYSVKECPQHIVDDYFSYYGNNCTDKTEIYPDILEMLNILYETGIKMAVVSNKAEIFAKKIINHFSLNKFFLHITGGDTFSFKKPSPEPLLCTVKKICNVSENYKIIMIGDSENDIASGNEAGFKTCLCTYGYGKKLFSKPDFVAKSAKEICNIVMNNAE